MATRALPNRGGRVRTTADFPTAMKRFLGGWRIQCWNFWTEIKQEAGPHTPSATQQVDTARAILAFARHQLKQLCKLAISREEKLACRQAGKMLSDFEAQVVKPLAVAAGGGQLLARKQFGRVDRDLGALAQGVEDAFRLVEVWADEAR